MQLWQTSILLAATGTLVSALPASTNPLTSRYTECSANTQWYVCAKNKFAGCCSVDPCDMESCPDGKKPPQACVPSSQTRIYAPEMQAVENGQVQPGIGKDFDISKSGSTFHDQQMKFKLPSNADYCAVGWSVPVERKFTVDGNGKALISVVGQDGALDPVGLANFEQWPQNTGAHDHPVTGTRCQEELNLRLSLDPEGIDGRVYIAQNSNTGFYVTYNVTC
ncbi:hypothetical protein AJ78_02544 [Emergomyces pasteurianus Ep9510]|uniref:Chitin-binding type-4 domain-containing protein n=1 Tax=Emergomyces pasteurianus Ep9510 TaxID=1447872 RepID=A0A1J9QMI5_9EURO|nr:hypothetical protein AJ78_02544 [Emergomyces pasteurianus Ep9510]